VTSTEGIALQLARCLVTPRQVAHLEWLAAECERDDPEVQRLAADVLLGYVDALLLTAPRRELDRRDACGCHRGCTTLPHDCPAKCRWPSCLTEAEEHRLCDELEAEGL
jgi:hypothetical protein